MIPAFRRTGAGGPTLVCHPGGPGFSSRLFADLDGLAAHLDLVLVDPRGTGATPRPDDARAYALEDYADDLEELRAHLGLERMSLLGFSHGGCVAMVYAARHPERVARLVLVGTLARFDAAQEDAMHAAMEERADEPWYADAAAALAAEQAASVLGDDELTELCWREFPLYFARFGGPERAFLDSARETVNADALNLWNAEQFTTFDLRAQLARIEAPTLVVAGEADFICGPAAAREIAAVVPGAELALIPGAGHFVYVEQPRAFRDEILGFVPAVEEEARA